MQRKKTLLVTIDATQPSVVELTVAEQVQLDRLIDTSHGRIAERHGALLAPGTTRLALEAGMFCLRTLSDAQLRVVEGGVTTEIHANNKDVLPKPKPQLKGDDPDGEQASFTVV